MILLEIILPSIFKSIKTKEIIIINQYDEIGTYDEYPNFILINFKIDKNNWRMWNNTIAALNMNILS